MTDRIGTIQPEGFPGLPEDWVSEWETFPSADQKLQLFQVVHHPKDWQGHRALLIVHGMGEHGGRYLHAPHYLRGAVDAVYCLDQRGHGRSEGLRGHCDRFSEFTDDLALAISRIHQQLSAKFGKAELHVLGHSFGGLVVLRTLFLNATLPVKSAIISSPLLGIKVKVPLAKKLVGIALSDLWGTLQVTNEVDPSHLSHDPAVAKAYRSDRLVHNKITSRMYTEMTQAMEDTVSREAGFAYPMDMIVSLQDDIVDPDVTQKFFRDLKLRDKQLKTFPSFFHEPFTELGKEKAFEEVSTWIAKHRD